MNEKVQKTITTVKEFWGKQSGRNKGFYIGGLVLVVLIAGLAVFLINRKEYVTLYEGLENTEASEIMAIIEEAGYEATLKSGGTIVVPKGTESELAMTLAMQKYPKSHLDYDDYTENVGMFTTEAEEKQYRKMTEENRLAAVLGAFEGVDYATVELHLPDNKNTVIDEYKADPSATAVLYLEKDVKLTNEQIDGMRFAIRTATGIALENISLVDNYGVLLLAEDTPADIVAEETRRFKFKTDIENQIKAKIENLLAPAYGEDGFSAEVNMVLNFDSKVYEDTRYTPSTDDGRGMLQHSDAVQAEGGTVVDGGVQGVEVNADDTYPTADTDGNDRWVDNSLSNTYLINTYKEQVERAGYVIEGLSISAVIYTDYLPETTRAELVALIANAATVNPEIAQDVVSVANLQKLDLSLPAEAEKILFGLTLDQLVILAAILLGILLILIIVLVTLSSKSKKKRKRFEKTLLEQHALPEGEPLVENFFSLGMGGSHSVDIPSLLNGEDVESKESIIRRELVEFAQHSPEIVAQLLRNWLKEEE